MDLKCPHAYGCRGNVLISPLCWVHASSTIKLQFQHSVANGNIKDTLAEIQQLRLQVKVNHDATIAIVNATMSASRCCRFMGELFAPL